MVTPQPSMKEAKKEPSRAPTRTTGSVKDVRLCDHKTKVAERTERVVDTEVETTIHDDTNDGGDETTIKTSNTVRGKGLLVDVDEAIELTSSSALRRLGVVSETGTGVVERVDEEQ